MGRAVSRCCEDGSHERTGRKVMQQHQQIKITASPQIRDFVLIHDHCCFEQDHDNLKQPSEPAVTSPFLHRLSGIGRAYMEESAFFLPTCPPTSTRTNLAYLVSTLPHCLSSCRRCPFRTGADVVQVCSCCERHRHTYAMNQTR